MENPHIKSPSILGNFRLRSYVALESIVLFQIPPLNTKFAQLNSRNQNLFLRKCISIIHCWFACAGAFYLHFNPNFCQGWISWSQFWIGFLFADLVLSVYTGTCSPDDRNHHVLYLFVFLLKITVVPAKSVCLPYKVNIFRYYGDTFNQNTQFRLLLGKNNLNTGPILLVS